MSPKSNMVTQFKSIIEAEGAMLETSMGRMRELPKEEIVHLMVETASLIRKLAKRQ